MISRTSEQEQPTDTSKTSPEYRKKLLRKAAALGLAATALFGVAACGNSVDQVAQAKPVATAEATPRVSPTTAEATTAPTETASPTENADIAFNVEANKHSTYEQFKSRPQDEQLAFVWDNYELQISDGIGGEFMKAVPYGGSKSLYDYNPATPETVSKDNNGQEIVNQHSFAEAYANVQPTDPNAVGSSKANVTLEEKLLSGVYYYTDSKKDPRYAVSLDTITSSGTTQQLEGIDALRVDKFSSLQKGFDKNNQAIEYVDCWVNSAGNTEIQRLCLSYFCRQRQPRTLSVVICRRSKNLK